MAIRFRKSVRLGKNVRLNVSGSGISVTAGVPGLSVNTGSRGTYLNTSIPGTGIYSRKKIGGPLTGAGSASGAGGSAGAAGAGGAATGDTGAGARSAGTRGTGAGSRSGSSAVSQNPTSEQLQTWDATRAESEQATNDILEIYKSAPEVFSYQEILDLYQTLSFQPYERQAFPRPEPTQAEIEAALWQHTQQQVRPLLGRRQKQQEYYNANYQTYLQNYVNQYLAEKAAFDNSQAEAEASYNAANWENYSLQKSALERLLTNTADMVEDCVEEWLSSISLPVDISAQIEYDENSCTLLIDLDLPEIEDLPATTVKALKSGEIRIQNKTQKQLREEYANCVFGLAVFIAAGALNAHACIKSLVISGCTQRRNRIGDPVDEYIYSVKIPRDTMEHIRVTDPRQFVLARENRLNMSQTFVFKSITPYGEVPGFAPPLIAQ